jgi:hypothetical protein
MGSNEMDETQVNVSLTSSLQNDPLWIEFKSWLISNGCRFPNVHFNQLDFPVAFGDLGTIGVKAKSDIPSQKAFIFTPFSLIITPQLARSSDLSIVFNAFPKIFNSSVSTYDKILWTFLIFEKNKTENSFYAPYFSVINPEILCDWSEADLSELQDPFLISKCAKYKHVINKHFTLLKPVFDAFPDFFPSNE